MAAPSGPITTSRLCRRPRTGVNLIESGKAMSYHIISTDNCVFLTCAGISSLEEITAAWREVRAELAHKNLNRVLVDVTSLRTIPATAELFDLAKLFWQDGFPGFGRMALVIRWEQSRSAKLLEMLVRAVGMYLTVFVSEEQAEAWIADQSSARYPLPASNSVSITTPQPAIQSCG